MVSELGQVAIAVSDWEYGELLSSCKELLLRDWMGASIDTIGLGWKEAAGWDS